MADDDPRSDEQLLAAFLDGDRAAFSLLVRRHEDRVFAVAVRMTGNRTDALDATQDAFVAAFRRARSFRGEASFGTWLYRIAINSCHDLVRKRKPVAEPRDDGSVYSGRLEETAGLRVDVSRALQRLPEEYREAILLHDLAGLPYHEIARARNVPIGTVKSRISRGRRMLAGLLEPEVGTERSKKR